MKYISLILLMLLPLVGCDCASKRAQADIDYREKFLQIQYGMSDSQVKEILGEPKWVEFEITGEGKFVKWGYVKPNRDLIKTVSTIHFIDKGYGNYSVESVDFNAG